MSDHVNFFFFNPFTTQIFFFFFWDNRSEEMLTSLKCIGKGQFQDKYKNKKLKKKRLTKNDFTLKI